MNKYQSQKNDQSNKRQLSEDERKMLDIMSNIRKAYYLTASSFHNYFKTEFDITLRTDLHVQEKYIKQLYDDVDLFRFVDESVLYRIGTTQVPPNTDKFFYSMNDPYLLTESLDSVLHRIMYSAYPPDLINELRANLSNHINDDRIVNLVLGKLEIDLQ